MSEQIVAQLSIVGWRLLSELQLTFAQELSTVDGADADTVEHVSLVSVVDGLSSILRSTCELVMEQTLKQLSMHGLYLLLTLQLTHAQRMSVSDQADCELAKHVRLVFVARPLVQGMLAQ